jgi:hypothetical protein
MKEREEQRRKMPREKADEAHSGQKPQGGARHAPEHGRDEEDAGRREFGRDD